MLGRILHYWDAKLMLGMVLSTVITAFVGLFEKYIFNSWDFLAYLTVMIVLDTVLGVYIAIKQKKFHSKGYVKLIEKLTLYSIFLIATHIIFSFQVSGNHLDFITDYPKTAAYGALIVREAISLFEKTNIIRPGLLPSWVKDKLKSLDDGNTINKDKHE